MGKDTNYQPLTESSYLILLALLSEGHGYGIMQYVENMSRGRVKLGPGTLYGGLKSMMKKGWIEELEGDNSRRRCYRLTQEGTARLKAEVKRLEELVDLGKKTSPLLLEGGE